MVKLDQAQGVLYLDGIKERGYREKLNQVIKIDPLATHKWGRIVFRAEKAAKIETLIRDAFDKLFPGYQKIVLVMNKNEESHKAFQRMMDDEQDDGINFSQYYGAEKLDQLRKLYPRAAALLKAEEYQQSSWAEKFSAGKHAEERLRNGENWEIVMREMKRFSRV